MNQPLVPRGAGPPEEKKRHSSLEWVDEIVYLRGLAVVAVIFVHLADKLTEAGSHVSAHQLALLFFKDMITGYPAFIFASGFVLSRIWFKHPGDWKRFYSRRLRSVLPPFLIFSVVYFFYSGKYHGQPVVQLMWNIVVSLWKSDSASHLWFFSNILQLYLLLPVLCAVFDFFEHQGRIRWFLVLAFVGQALWLTYCALAKVVTPAGTLELPTIMVAERAAKGLFLVSLFYFSLGIASGRRYDRMEFWLRRIPAWTLISVALVCGAISLAVRMHGMHRYGDFYSIRSHELLWRFLINYICRTLFVFLLLLLAREFCRKPSWVGRIFGQFGKYSFGVYLVHVLFQQELSQFLVNHGVSVGNRYYYFLAFTGTAFLSLGVVRLLSKLPFSRYFIGQTWGRGAQETPARHAVTS